MNTRKKSQMLIYYEKFIQELLENPELYKDETDTGYGNEIEKKTEAEDEAKTKVKNDVKNKPRNKNKTETKKGAVTLRKDYAEVMAAITNVLKTVFPEKPQSIVCSNEGATLYYFSPENNEPIEIIIQPDVVKDIVEKSNKLTGKK